MPTHTPRSEDFVLDNNQTNIILGLSGRTVQKSLVDWVDGESIPDGQIAMTKRRGPKGYVMNFIAKSSVLAYLRLYGQSVNISRARGVIQDPTIIEELESHNRTVQPSDDSSEVPRERSERVPSPQGGEVVSELRERLAEKDERIADLQTRLDETQGKYETILVESGEKQQALLLQRVGVEKALSGMIYKVQKAEPQLRFIEQKDERGVIVDVEVVKDASKSFPWPYVWGAVSTIALLGLGTYLAVTYRLLG